MSYAVVFQKIALSNRADDTLPELILHSLLLDVTAIDRPYASVGHQDKMLEPRLPHIS